MKSKSFLAVMLFAVFTTLFTGCGSIRSQGGTTRTSTPTITTQAAQPESPKDATTQDVSSETEESFVVPAGSAITVEEPVVATDKDGKQVVTGTKRTTTTPSAPMPVTKKRSDGAKTKVGAAQKDTVAETIANVRAFRWLQIVGAAVFLFGVASAFIPILKVIVGGSLTTSAAIAGAGLFLIFFPPFFVGHEVLIFCGCIGAAGLWFLAHRHGGVSGELTAAKTFIQHLTDRGAATPAKPAPIVGLPKP